MAYSDCSSACERRARRSSRYERRTRSRPTDRTPSRVLFREAMVVAEQVQPRPHRGEHLVDLRLAGVAARGRPETAGTASPPRGSGTRRCRAAPCTPRPLRGRSAGACRPVRVAFARALLRVRQLGGGVSIPASARRCRRDRRPADPSTTVDRAVGNVMQVRRQIAARRSRRSCRCCRESSRAARRAARSAVRRRRCRRRTARTARRDAAR